MVHQPQLVRLVILRLVDFEGAENRYVSFGGDFEGFKDKGSSISFVADDGSSSDGADAELVMMILQQVSFHLIIMVVSYIKQ